MSNGAKRRRSPAQASRPKDLRLEAFERMQAAYDAYRDNPQRKTTAFRALRALVHLCRLHGMTGDQAALLAELGRADEDAGAGWRLSLDRRSSSAIRERARRERERNAASEREARRWSRFAAVLGRVDNDDTLAEAFVAVAKNDPAGEEAVRKDYQAIARAYRAAGIFEVPFREPGHTVPLPRPGAPRGPRKKR